MAPVVPEIPERRGGWWHEYVCPAHGTELRPPRNGVFGCPHGCALSGEPYAGAWAVLAHQAAARGLRRLAVAGRDGDAASADAAVDGLVRYAGLHRRLATEVRIDAQPWMLAGKLFQQALTEAVWGVSLALAAQTLAGSVDRGRLEPVAVLLRTLRADARRARAVLLGKDDFANNYTAWLVAAGAATSRALALLGDPDETPEWITGPHGVAAHAAAATHPDGWEWEGSAYYHVFVLRAYLLALRGTPAGEIPEGLAERLRAMTGVVGTLATDQGGRLPAVHDSPYGDPGWDEELYELCLLAGELPLVAVGLGFLEVPLAARLGVHVVGWRVGEARRWFGRLPAVVDSGGPNPWRAAAVYRDTGYAVLRSGGLRAVLDFGPHGGSHGHRDKLALYLYGPTAPWQPAYGVPPYGSPLRKGYYARTAAHPTLSVDGAEQAEATGRLRHWCTGSGRPGEPLAEVGAEAEVYPGVAFRRFVRAEVDHLVDVVWARADTEREFVLHLRADVEVTLRHDADGSRTDWPGDGGLVGRHVAPGPAVLSTGADRGPADDPQRTRPHLRWTAHGRRAVFVSVYSPAARPVARVRVTEDGPLEVVVERGGRDPVRWTVPVDGPVDGPIDGQVDGPVDLATTRPAGRPTEEDTP